MMPEISVVVPIYNTAAYLKQCLDSLAAQTMQLVEVLLIDDGSTDGSRSICETYCGQFPWFRYYYKENGGLSDARNYGLQHVCGKYVAFVDSDDYVEADFLEQLWSTAEQKNAQMVCCGYYAEDSRHMAPMCKLKSGVISPEELWKSIFAGEEIGTFMCNKLFRSELFNDVKFPLGKKYEDMHIFYKLEAQCKQIVLVSRALYHYVSRKGALTSRLNSKDAEDFLEAGRLTYAYVAQAYPSLKPYCDMYMVRLYVDIINGLSKSGFCYGDLIWNQACDYVRTHREGRRKLRGKRRLSAEMICLFPAQYGMLRSMREKRRK